MSEQDRGAADDLFDSEPQQPSAPEAAEWVAVYRRLVELLEPQLEETRRFSATVPEAMRQYLSRENIQILTEELETFRTRLSKWMTA